MERKEMLAAICQLTRQLPLNGKSGLLANKDKDLEQQRFFEDLDFHDTEYILLCERLDKLFIEKKLSLHFLAIQVHYPQDEEHYPQNISELATGILYMMLGGPERDRPDLAPAITVEHLTSTIN